MILAPLFVTAQFADLMSGILLPAGAEANGIILALGLPLASVAKATLIGCTLWFTKRIDFRLRRAILLFGAAAGIIGLSTNLAWLM